VYILSSDDDDDDDEMAQVQRSRENHQETKLPALVNNKKYKICVDKSDQVLPVNAHT
jgi:hypothetical protein